MKKLTSAGFAKKLLDWFGQQSRPLPWKGVKDPYLIWLSEIILQQTRVKQGLPYFEQFKKHFPTIGDLAAASEDEVLRLWQGLGYYSRARNMHATAQRIVQEMGGQFPESYEALLLLKGVGPYTAAAIASFAFGEVKAVVDGNVYRVLARIYGMDDPVDSSAGKKQFAQLAQRLISRETPGRYNQAIMDFGALQCTPRRPDCANCTMQKNCVAFGKGKVEKLPVKTKRIKKRKRFFHFLLLNFGESLFVQKRKGQDIWQHLYQFPMIESDSLMDGRRLKEHIEFKRLLDASKYELLRFSAPFEQQLSHQKIIARFFEIALVQRPLHFSEGNIEVNRGKLNKFALPKIIDWYLQDKSLFLELY